MAAAEVQEWMHLAWSYRLAARVLWRAYAVNAAPRPPLEGPYLLASGLALELLLKAAKLARGERPKLDHHLATMAAEVFDRELSAEERAIFEAWEAYVRWAARYPTAKRADDDTKLDRALESAPFAEQVGPFTAYYAAPMSLDGFELLFEAIKATIDPEISLRS